MGKIWTYIVLTAGLILMLKLAGIPTGVEWLLVQLGLSDTYNVSGSTFAIAVGILLATSTGVGIVIGIFGRTAPEYALLAPFAIASLVVFASTFGAVINYMSNFDTWLYYPIFVIFGVFGMGFFVALVEWAFGREA